MRTISPALLAIAAVSLSLVSSACAVQTGSSPDDAPVASTSEAMAGQFVAPQGLACGLSHTGGPRTACEGLTYTPGEGGAIPPGYTSVFTGDWGMPSGQGFAHDSVTETSASAATFATDRLPITAGVTCGLKHSNNAPNERCMGFDAAVACPAGWIQRSAEDLASCRIVSYHQRCESWSWCEYQDPHGLCSTPGGAQSCLRNVPPGTVCGLGHTPSSAWGTAATVGFCQGDAIGVNRNQSGVICPSGYGLVGPRDQGGESGAGLVWCAKG